MITRKHLIFISALVLAVLFAVVGITLAADKTVDIRNKSGLGSYLVDARGMTLYIFKNDSPGKSACAGPCVGIWPPFYTEYVETPGGLSEGDFGTITRDDGKKQTTYKGLPLYNFSGDKGPGDTTGNGFRGLWSVAQP